MTKGSLKDKLEGNHLDLSLSGLTTVPVKEIAALRRVTSLDLSCNLLKSLPDDFCTLTQLVKVDLSKNQLYDLPENFGTLRSLRHLDLLGNQLSTLPVSFCSLDELHWLDLKDNPLALGLKAAAGDCLDDGQCRKCGKQVVLYMKQVQSAMESQRQKLLQVERAEEASRREAEQREKRVAKQAEKERRRAEYESKQRQRQEEDEASAAAARATSAESEAAAATVRAAGSRSPGRPGAKGDASGSKVGAGQRGRSWCCAIVGWLLLAILAVVLFATLAYFYCNVAQGTALTAVAEQCRLVVSTAASLRRQAEQTLRTVRLRLEL